MHRRLWPIAVTVLAASCSSSEAASPPVSADTGSAPAEDTRPATDTASPGAETGSCAGLTGTYDATRKRSTTSPGSCAPDLKFAAAIPIKVTADASSSSGYKLEIGYSDDTGAVTYITCVNNVSGCTFFATCEPAAGTDQVELTIATNAVSGTIKRTDKTSKCTVNFDLTGTRK